MLIHTASLVEHKGFEPLTSSMPWKRASQLRQCPNGYYFNRKPSRRTRWFLAAARPPGAACFRICLFLSSTGHPMRISIPKVCTVSKKNASGFIQEVTMAFFYIVWLDKHVQKHTRSRKHDVYLLPSDTLVRRSNPPAGRSDSILIK